MPLTRHFKETIQTRVQTDSTFRQALFEEAVQCLLLGDLETGKSILRDTINATIGFDDLGKKTKKSPKSLMRMFSDAGNPQARNLLQVIALLQDAIGVQIRVQALPV